jgi:branched-chain amino acid transport system permease protein
VAVTIWTGLTLGAVYVLVATGLMMSLLPSGVFNFAQGAVVVGGTFTAYLWLYTLHLPELVALLLNIVAGAIAGVTCELLCVRPLRLRRRGLVLGGPTELVTTVGMSTALLGIVGVIWGYNPLLVPFRGPSGQVKFLGVLASPVQIILVALAVASPLLFAALFRFTRVGQACLSVAEDRDAAALRGVNVSLLSVGGFALAGSFGGLAAIIIGPYTYAVATQATALALGGFVAISLGGQGSFVGVLIGGLVVGLASTFGGRYLGANYGDVMVFATLLVVLTIRPRGIGGLAEARRV